MNFEDFTALVSNATDPVVLVEGRCSIPETSDQSARRVATLLAGRFPRLRFRSGNATGTHEAFASGIIAAAPERLEINAPHASHRPHPRTSCLCMGAGFNVCFAHSGFSISGHLAELVSPKLTQRDTNVRF